MVGDHERGRGHLDGARRGAPRGGRRTSPRWAGVLPAGLARGVEKARHAGRPLAVVEVADLQLCAATRRAVAVLGHGHRRALPHDVPPQADPAAALQFEAQAGRLGEGAVERGRQGGGLQDEHLHADAPGVGREPPQERFVEDREARRQVQHEQVHRPPRDERAGQPQPLLRAGRAEHDEPAQVHAARRRLQRVEGTGQIQPGDDAAGRLGRRDAAQRERRLARGGVAAEGRRGPARQAARAQDGVERGEAGRDGLAVRGRDGDDLRRREEGQGAGGRGHGVDPSSAPEPDRGAPPARLEAGEGAAEGLVGPDRDRRHGSVHDRTDVRYVNRHRHPSGVAVTRAVERGKERRTTGWRSPRRPGRCCRAWGRCQVGRAS